MGGNRAILEYRRTLRLRVAEYERDMLIGYRLAREVADCGLVQAALGLETALAGLQREIGLVRSHLLYSKTSRSIPLSRQTSCSVHQTPVCRRLLYPTRFSESGSCAPNHE
jgi:hypothetical protein